MQPGATMARCDKIEYGAHEARAETSLRAASVEKKTKHTRERAPLPLPTPVAPWLPLPWCAEAWPPVEPGRASPTSEGEGLRAGWPKILARGVEGGRGEGG